MSFRLHCVATLTAAALIFLLTIVYRTNTRFVATGLPVAVFLVTIVAFNAHRIRLLRQTIYKLDELLCLLQRTRGDLSARESRMLDRELSEIRAGLLRERSFQRRREHR